MDKIHLLGKDHAITLPDFTAREELLVAYHEGNTRKGITLLRAYSAILGLCTRLGRSCGADYGKHRFDALAYGGEVYGWLRQQGATQADIAAQAIPVLTLLVEKSFPTVAEVETAKGNFEGRAE